MSIFTQLAQSPESYYNTPEYQQAMDEYNNAVDQYSNSGMDAYNDTLHNYSTNGYNEAATAAGLAVFGGAILMFMIVAIAISYVITSLFLSMIFKKAGIESWKAWVPVYNTWIMLEMGGQKGFWAVLAFVPLVNIAAAVFMIMAMYSIGLKFGKDGAFVLLAIFLPYVWLIWLAVDKSTWHGKKPTLLTTKK